MLPLSPLPAIEDRNRAALPLRGLPPRLFLLPAVAVLLTLGGLTAFYYFFWAPSPDAAHETKADLSAADSLGLARKHLSMGNFRLAAQELSHRPAALETLNRDDRRSWRNLFREASLLADLLAEPIEDIVRHAAGVSEAEWQADFPRRYEGKSLIFDVRVHQDNGHVKAVYVPTGVRPWRLELRDLDLFPKMNVDQSRRVIFGARLVKVALEPPGPAWVIRFQPGSGVLLTDARAAALCCPPLGEPEAVRLIAEQAHEPDAQARE